MSTSAGVSTYAPLNAEPREIRIAILEASETSTSDIKVRLVPTSLESTPICEDAALSYFWGDANITKPIFLNDIETPVTSNLGNLRLADSERTVWIDALCINQQDIDERNQQIFLMPAIYSLAYEVIIWLGESRANTSIAMNFIAKHVHLDRGVINNAWLLKTLEEPSAPRAFQTIVDFYREILPLEDVFGFDYS